MQRKATKRHDQQMFLVVFVGNDAEGRPIAHFARNNVVAISREAAASLSLSAHFELPYTQYLPPVADACLQKAKLDALQAAFSRVERALTESGFGLDHFFSWATAIVL